MVLSLLLSVMPLALHHAGASVATAAPWVPEPWHVTAKLSRGDQASVSCPTSSVCWAIAGGQLLSSQDGGLSWSTRTGILPDEVDVLGDLDCPTVTTCFVTAQLAGPVHAVLVVGPSGVSSANVPSSALLRSITCPTSARCLTTDRPNVFRSTDGGASWHARPRPPSMSSVEDLTCVPGTSTCWAVGSNSSGASIARTTNLAGGWETQTGVNSIHLTAVDCPSVSACYAVGQRWLSGPVAVVTTDGGATWTNQTLPPISGLLESVSCPSPDVCWATGDLYRYAFATVDAGAHWTAQEYGPQYAGLGSLELSCPTVTACAAVGHRGGGFATANAGGTWTAAAVPVALGAVTALSCPRRLWCVGTATSPALRHLAITSGDGGASWTQHLLPTPGYVSSLDCPSVSTCHAWAFFVNGIRLYGESLSSTDGGVTWRRRSTAETRSLGVGRVSCPAPSTCLAVGNGRTGSPVVLSTTDGGTTWASRSAPQRATDLYDVSCTTVASCVLLGWEGSPHNRAVAYTTDDLGTTYHAHELPSPHNRYTALDCAKSNCYALGNDSAFHGLIAASTDAGGAWTAQRVPVAADRLRDISCGGATICVASGADPANVIGTRNRGRTWNILPTPPPGSAPNAVACAGLACLAADHTHAGTPRIIAGSP